MRTPAQRGPIGNWLRDERVARGWTSAEKARANLARAGIVVAQSVYAEWESGSRIPSEAQLEKLQAFFGTTPGATSAGTGDQSEVVAALKEQTKAISELVALLRPMAEAQALQVADLQRAVQRLYALVTPIDPELPSRRPIEQ